MRVTGQHKPQHIHQAQDNDGSFPTNITSCHNKSDEASSGERHRNTRGNTEMAECQRNCGELGDQRQEVLDLTRLSSDRSCLYPGIDFRNRVATRPGRCGSRHSPQSALW